MPLSPSQKSVCSNYDYEEIDESSYAHEEVSKKMYSKAPLYEEYQGA